MLLSGLEVQLCLLVTELAGFQVNLHFVIIHPFPFSICGSCGQHQYLLLVDYSAGCFGSKRWVTALSQHFWLSHTSPWHIPTMGKTMSGCSLISISISLLNWNLMVPVPVNFCLPFTHLCAFIKVTIFLATIQCRKTAVLHNLTSPLGPHPYSVWMGPPPTDARDQGKKLFFAGPQIFSSSCQDRLTQECA